MTGSLMSWDDLDENPNIAAAAANLKTLDVEHANKAFEEQSSLLAANKQLADIGAKPIPPQPIKAATPNRPIIAGGLDIPKLAVDTAALTHSPLHRAAKAVVAYGERMDYGARVLAINKRLINSTTDLNQLIPFKYTWAWSMYLDSTNAHWMPTEAEGYLEDEVQYPTLHQDAQKLISRFVVNYMYSTYVYSPIMLVNTYRLSSNPETRQYQLRQVFEEQVFHHSIRHMVEIFDLDRSDILLHKPDEETFRQRNLALAPYLRIANDLSATTQDPKDTGDFLVALAAMYGGMRGLYHLIPMFQLVKYSEATGLFLGVRQNIKWILRDMGRQIEFGCRYINGIVDENPGCFTESVKERIQQALTNLHESNLALLKTNATKSEDYSEGEYVSKWFMNTFLQSINVGFEPQQTKPQYESFIGMFKSELQVDHGTAQVSIGGSTGGSLGDWD